MNRSGCISIEWKREETRRKRTENEERKRENYFIHKFLFHLIIHLHHSIKYNKNIPFSFLFSFLLLYFISIQTIIFSFAKWLTWENSQYRSRNDTSHLCWWAAHEPHLCTEYQWLRSLDISFWLHRIPAFLVCV